MTRFADEPPRARPVPSNRLVRRSPPPTDSRAPIEAAIAAAPSWCGTARAGTLVVLFDRQCGSRSPRSAERGRTEMSNGARDPTNRPASERCLSASTTGRSHDQTGSLRSRRPRAAGPAPAAAERRRRGLRAAPLPAPCHLASARLSTVARPALPASPQGSFKRR